MATISVICYKSKTLANGEHPLVVRISKDSKKSYKYLGVSVNPKHWDFKKNEPKPNCPNREHILKIIQDKKAEYQTQVLEFKTFHKNFTASTLIKTTEQTTIAKTVDIFYKELIAHYRQIGKIGNSNIYRDSYNSIKTFKKVDKLDFLFSEINLAWLNEYEKFLISCNKAETTMSLLFRTLRSSFNKAIEQNLVRSEDYPFKSFKMSKFNLKTRKRAITKEEIRKILELMVIIVTDSIKNISIAPEINRDRTMYIKHFCKYGKEKKDRMWSGSLPYDVYKNYLSDLKSPESIAVIDNTWSGDQYMVKEDYNNQRFLAKTKMTNADFWKVLSFSFVEGRSFTQEEFESGIRNTVITESMAKKVFGNTNPLGKNIEIDFKEYNVIGVIKDVSQTFTYAYAEVYIPYTSKGGYESRQVLMMCLMKDKADFDLLKEEFRAAERKFNAVDNEWDLTLRGPYGHKEMSLAIYSNLEPGIDKANRKMIFIIAILLLIPAVNLSSFSMSRIKRRTEEIGIRKAFGAKKYVILIQVIYENLITSFLGGIIGLLLSYLVVIWLKQWLLDIGTDSSIPIGALVSVPVFLGVFAACFLLNLLSAGLPAYRASTMKIVDSLNQKNA